MLKVIGLENAIEWDKIVKSFQKYDVYYLSGYVYAFKIHGDGEPLLFFYESDKCKGINVVMKRDIHEVGLLHEYIEKGKFYDFATPYGYGGWIIEGDDSETLFFEYEEWCHNNGIISEFVRFHPILCNHNNSDKFYDVVPLGETVSIDTSNKENIWANFNGKNRNVIRKSINNNVVIKHDLSQKLMNTFVKIYNGTMDKDNADKYYYFESGFYESIIRDLKQNATIFYAEYENKIIAASIMLYANGKLNYHLSGSLRDYQYLAPTNLLLWKAAEWGNEIGCKTFHLGGGVGSAEDGLFKFKKSFYRGDLCRYHIGKKIFNNEMYVKLVQLSNTDDSSFFPKYRGKK